MTHARFLRETARSLRVERQLTVDQLAARLSLPRSTVYYWVRDLPLRHEGRDAHGPKPPGKARRVRSEAAYEEGLESFAGLSAQPTFRDFICVYLAQGDRRDRTHVALTHSDPDLMRLASRWIRRLSDRTPLFSLRCESGQGSKELRRFWSETTGAEERRIRVHALAEGESEGRALARSPHGLLTVAVEDTLLRARLQGWIERTRETWR